MAATKFTYIHFPVAPTERSYVNIDTVFTTVPWMPPVFIKSAPISVAPAPVVEVIFCKASISVQVILIWIQLGGSI